MRLSSTSPCLWLPQQHRSNKSPRDSHLPVPIIYKSRDSYLPVPGAWFSRKIYLPSQCY